MSQLSPPDKIGRRVHVLKANEKLWMYFLFRIQQLERLFCLSSSIARCCGWFPPAVTFTNSSANSALWASTHCCWTGRKQGRGGRQPDWRMLELKPWRHISQACHGSLEMVSDMFNGLLLPVMQPSCLQPLTCTGRLRSGSNREGGGCRRPCEVQKNPNFFTFGLDWWKCSFSEINL